MSHSLARQGALRFFVSAILVLGLFLTLPACSGNSEDSSAESAGDGNAAVTVAENPPIVTSDIKAGIEKHIDDVVAANGGHFPVVFEGGKMHLNLVRIHMEYLASLGPQTHFACVDMVTADGEFYDVDFFMAGNRGEMTVTETTVHKLNGQPYYLWEQNEDETWVRTPVDDAANELMGVLGGTDTFEFRYTATLPRITGDARCWLPLVESDDFQTVEVRSKSLPGNAEVVTDSAHGNKVIVLELTAADSGKTIEIVYDVERKEKSAYTGDPAEANKHLEAERLVPSDGVIKTEADQATAGLDSEMMKARALYDHVMEQMQYKKFGKGWGQGDAMFACSTLYGNCTDYHAYFIGLARSVGIPARFAIGASIPSARNDGATSGYHCWAEFYAEGKWWPVDISEADKFSALSTYYFGHHPANRIEFSRGRDLMVEPLPESGPINFLAYPLLEMDGGSQMVKCVFLFQRKIAGQES